MKSKIIQSLEASCIIYFLARCFFLGISYNSIVNVAYEDNWIVILIGCILGLIPLFLYLKLLDYDENMNIIELIKHLFGNVIGSFINIVLSLFILFFAIIIFWNLTHFINSQFLSGTPSWAVSLIFLIPIFYLLSKDISTITRTALILFIISLSLYLLSMFGLTSQIDLDNVKPLFNSGFMNLLTGTFRFLCYNIFPLFFLTLIPKKFLKDKSNYKKQVLIVYLITSLLLIIGSFIITGVLGVPLMRLYEYPEFHVLKKVTLLGFVDRIETIVSLRWFFDLFLSICICIYFAMEVLKSNFKMQNRILNQVILFVVCTFVAFISTVFFHNDSEATKFFGKVFPYLLCLVFFLIPIVIWIFTIFKKKKQR